jgi:RNAse (barnase) inhibitor barstar
MDKVKKLFANSKHCGVYHTAEKFAAIEHGAKVAGLAVFKIDIASVRNKDDLLETIASALEFPPTFGKNWDALNDCLTDLSWLDRKGWVLIIENCANFAQPHKADFDTLVKILRAASAYWRDQAKPFWVLIYGPKNWHSGLPDIPRI